jgi:hypothetical protein
MKIAHIQLSGSASGGRMGRLTERIEHLRGVAGVAVVRSMGLLTVLYDELRTSPVAISDAIVQEEAESDPEPAPPAPAFARAPARVSPSAVRAVART